MSKRIIAIVCALVLAVSVLAGCGQNSQNINIPVPTVTDSDGNTVTPTPTQAPDNNNNNNNSNNNNSNNNNNNNNTVTIPATTDAGKGTLMDGLEAVAIPFNDNGSMHVYLLVTNKTGKVVDLSADIDFFNGDKIVGFDSEDMDTVDNETTVCMDYMYCDEPFTTFEYKVKFRETDTSYYAPVDKNLSLDVSPLTDKVIVSLTNNGKIPAKYVWYHAFFYKNGELIYVDNNYCEDDDSEIKVGATVRSEQYFWGDEDKGFDDVKVFYHGEGYVDN